ncbi:MAG: Nramp family divalent metal transporter [Agrococcus casei]|uniref:Nramp family divalent metal transporter n=1 Tax=Agrococcus casei TaxID=343512 RepID=UPI003F8FD7BB
MSQTEVPKKHHITESDPYKLDAADVQKAPTRFRERFKYLGPGIITSAMIVGSGELIVTTSLGAQAGFALLWMVIIASTVKVWVQLELAQWTIITGKPALEGYASIGPKVKGLGIINYAWIIMELCKALQRGGIIGGTAGALSILAPVIGEPLSGPSLAFWAIVTTLTVIAMMITAKYSVVERICVVAIVVLTAITVGLAAVLPMTDYAYSAADIASGLTFAIPAGALGFAVAMFGITGVGAEEMTAYTYWCIEKGYARWTGPNDGTKEWQQRAKGWINIMRLDVLVGWMISTICTMSFFTLGASILHPQGLVPSGNEMLLTLSNIYTSILGDWASTLFLVGAIFVLFSTVIGVAASVPRQWANTFGLMGLFDWKDMAKRKKWIRVLTVIIPSLWCISFLIVNEPVIMVLIGGTAAGIFLLAVVVAVWVLRTRDEPKVFRKNTVLNVILAVCSLLVAALAIYSVVKTFGIEIG